MELTNGSEFDICFSSSPQKFISLIVFFGIKGQFGAWKNPLVDTQVKNEETFDDQRFVEIWLALSSFSCYDTFILDTIFDYVFFG